LATIYAIVHEPIFFATEMLNAATTASVVFASQGHGGPALGRCGECPHRKMTGWRLSGLKIGALNDQIVVLSGQSAFWM